MSFQMNIQKGTPSLLIMPATAHRQLWLKEIHTVVSDTLNFLSSTVLQNKKHIELRKQTRPRLFQPVFYAFMHEVYLNVPKRNRRISLKHPFFKIPGHGFLQEKYEPEAICYFL